MKADKKRARNGEAIVAYLKDILRDNFLTINLCIYFECFPDKVENISKVSLDSILSSSVKVQIAGRCQQTFENKKFVDITQQCFTLLPKVNFAANNLNFY